MLYMSVRCSLLQSLASGVQTFCWKSGYAKIIATMQVNWANKGRVYSILSASTFHNTLLRDVELDLWKLPLGLHLLTFWAALKSCSLFFFLRLERKWGRYRSDSSSHCFNLFLVSFIVSVFVILSPLLSFTPLQQLMSLCLWLCLFVSAGWIFLNVCEGKCISFFSISVSFFLGEVWHLFYFVHVIILKTVLKLQSHQVLLYPNVT